MKIIKKLYCPICGKEMSADIHAPEDGAKWRNPPGPPPSTTESLRELDNWICFDKEGTHCVVFDRDDIKEWQPTSNEPIKIR